MTTTPVRRAAASALVAATLGASLLGVAGAPAQASGDDRVERSGSCSGPGAARWKLKAKSDDGGVEVEGEVDSNRAGQTWQWVIKADGDLVARGTSRTRGPSGSFSVERRARNGAGTELFTFRAERGGSGEVCAGSVRF
ncbi:hypothetical protein [Nocardioides sp. CFH 31398]|uniref:hypothetical protein n=1 Tax=Nocardioides sp. CFH 31398 TaxID=2919579 RepID=UPI001F057B21|nr:hypothetical protein [Nocardioides sp. CFH 31398]MCH1866536.1 hypothetical protein [Nocardioides sp. CFH 31398]